MVTLKRVRKMKVFNQKGMSLVEVMVAISISAVVSLGMLQINQTGIKATNRSTTDLSLTMFRTATLEMNLAKPEICEANFQGDNGAVADNITSLVNDAAVVFATTVAPNNFTADRDWQINSITREAFVASTVGGTSGRCDLTILLSRNKMSFGSQDKRLTIPIFCQVDGGNLITTCMAASGNSDSIWTLVYETGYEFANYNPATTGGIVIGPDPTATTAVTASIEITQDGFDWAFNPYKTGIKMPVNNVVTWDRWAITEDDSGSAPCYYVMARNTADSAINTHQAVCRNSAFFRGEGTTTFTNTTYGINMTSPDIAVGMPFTATFVDPTNLNWGGIGFNLRLDLSNPATGNLYSGSAAGLDGGVGFFGDLSGRAHIFTKVPGEVVTANLVDMHDNFRHMFSNSGYSMGVTIDEVGTTENTLSGTHVVAIGTANEVAGSQSVAIGSGNASDALRSFAMGLNSGADGDYSFAFGNTVYAGNTGSVAFGINSTSIGNYSVSFGNGNNVQADYSFANGRTNTTSAAYTVAFGETNTVSAFYSTVFGRSNTSAGSYSLASGFSNEADGSYSTAIGYDNTVDGAYSGAIGYQNNITINHQASFAFGRGLLTDDDDQIVLGRYNTDVADDSNRVFVVGGGTSAGARKDLLQLGGDGYLQLNEGLFTVWNSGDSVFGRISSFGWQDGIHRQTLTPSQLTQNKHDTVFGNNMYYYTADTDPYNTTVWGNYGGYHHNPSDVNITGENTYGGMQGIVMNSVPWDTDGAGTGIHKPSRLGFLVEDAINYAACVDYVAGGCTNVDAAMRGWFTSQEFVVKVPIYYTSMTATAGSHIWSDKRLKKDVQHLENSLDKILKLNGVSYVWKEKEEIPSEFHDSPMMDLWVKGGQKDVGFIAQEVEKMDPLLVNIQKDSAKSKSVNYTGVIPYLVEAVKEFYAEFKKIAAKVLGLESQMKELKEENRQLKEAICEINPKSKVCVGQEIKNLPEFK
jgi:prepilin-type N-terminal cleavage/methylation domain-containing protein